MPFDLGVVKDVEARQQLRVRLRMLGIENLEKVHTSIIGHPAWKIQCCR